jgi:aspartate aminotransferase-like enzyme
VKRTAAMFIVDAITGIGSMPLDIDRWGLDFVIGGSQKAFMLPPGLAFLTISPKAWEMMESARLPRYYFDLRREKKSAAKGESSWTPAIALILGLAEVLKYVKTLGMEKLIENAQQLAAATRAACGALGLELLSPAHPSGAVTAVKAPPGLSSSVIVEEFHEKFGSIIADGQGEMAGRIFRIAHLGYYDIADLFALMAELELILLAHDVPVKLGAGVAALQEYYASQPANRKHPVPV